MNESARWLGPCKESVDVRAFYAELSMLCTTVEEMVREYADGLGSARS